MAKIIDPRLKDAEYRRKVEAAEQGARNAYILREIQSITAQLQQLNESVAADIAANRAAQRK